MLDVDVALGEGDLDLVPSELLVDAAVEEIDERIAPGRVIQPYAELEQQAGIAELDEPDLRGGSAQTSGASRAQRARLSRT